MTWIWGVVIWALLLCCCKQVFTAEVAENDRRESAKDFSQRACRIRFLYPCCGSDAGGVDSLVITGAGSGTGASGGAMTTAGVGSTGCIATTGTSIFCRQYETAIPRCQKRGISNRNRVIWATTKAPTRLSGDTNLSQTQSPATRKMAARMVETIYVPRRRPRLRNVCLKAVPMDLRTAR